MLSLNLDTLHVESFDVSPTATTGTTSGTPVGSFTGPCCSFDTCTGPGVCQCVAPPPAY
jgi:hypothetical protein